MPPRKRKASVSESEHSSAGEGASDGKPKAKKPAAKKGKGPVTPIDSSLPHNTAFPAELNFVPRKEGKVRLACWNVGGIRACDKKVRGSLSAGGGGADTSSGPGTPCLPGCW